MHQGPIILPDPIRLKCFMTLDLGCLLRIVPFDLLPRVFIVRDRLTKNTIMIHDLQDLHKLANALINCDCLDNILTESIQEFLLIIDLFITVAAAPIRQCGLW